MNARKYIILLLWAALLWGCSTTRSLSDGEYLLRSNQILVNSKEVKPAELSSYLSQKPNTYLLGLNPFLSVYNWSGHSNKGLPGFWRKIGEAPVVYDPSEVDASVSSIDKHLQYMGFYDSQVESQVKVKGRKVYVTYYVAPGKQYTISAIDYDIPSYGTLKQEFEADIPNITIHPGDKLSEASLEAEAERQAQYFRTLGYFGFNKSFYHFEADTLAADGSARLIMSIRDYALGDVPESAKEHKKFHLGEVTITHPERLKIRKSVLENLNTLRPGQMYSEPDINTVYNRFSSVSMLSAVNVGLTPVSDDQVDCNISLRNSGLQGFKTSLEASVNSTALIGISPQLTYYHKNLFHGGEVLNLGVKGNFQFKPKDTAYSTEVSVSSSLRFPMFLGLPNRLFKGPYIPNTDINLTFSYQDRPEYRRTVIGTSFAYNGRFGPQLFYQFTPFRANMVRVFDMSESFASSIMNNIYMLGLYSDLMDFGVSSMLYYTTDSSPIPLKPYHYVRLNLDVSGNVISLFNNLLPMGDDGTRLIWATPYAQYVRAELQLGKTFRFGSNLNHSLALRFLAGAGYAYGNSDILPLDKMFYSGGASSMRGWQARTLGPGTDTSLKEFFVLPSQIGDMKLEANIEYRFPMFWKLEGALFADAGNIWDIPGSDDEEDYGDLFHFKTLPESIGLDWGLGIRLNLTFILIRVDAGVRLHDPARAAGDRWVPPAQWFKGNTAVHFGVGYPF